MSTGLIMPILAIGGIVILGNYLTKKTKKHKHRYDDSSSSRSVSSSTKQKRRKSKTKKNELNTDSILKVKKSKKKNINTPSIVKVKKSKSKKLTSTSKRKVSVFYKLGSKRGQNWRYHKLPKGWVLKKKKDINIDNYSKEVDFEGPKSERDSMIKYLEKVFSYLKKNNIINKYKIQKVKK